VCNASHYGADSSVGVNRGVHDPGHGVGHGFDHSAHATDDVHDGVDPGDTRSAGQSVCP
jgi:hypothetical protein